MTIAASGTRRSLCCTGIGDVPNCQATVYAIHTLHGHTRECYNLRISNIAVGGLCGAVYRAQKGGQRNALSIKVHQCSIPGILCRTQVPSILSRKNTGAVNGSVIYPYPSLPPFSAKLTLHATRRTPHGASRLMHAMSAWSVQTLTCSVPSLYR